MAEIPYFFETPVPKYFRENGWFECEHMFKFVNWAFSKCQTIPHKTVIHGKEILLAPYEFIAGRLTSPKECFLTENIFRNQLISLQKGGLLKKSTNSLTNKYTCYIWVTACFSKKINQQNNQQSTNSQPTVNHESEEKKSILKEDHPSTPSGSTNGMTDDFSSQLEKIEVYPGIFLCQDELDACIKIKGNVEKVKEAMEFIQKNPRRKHPITDWVNALTRWKIEDKSKARFEDNLVFAEKICEEFAEFLSPGPWYCRMSRDKKKDQRGLLFYSSSSYQEAFFVPVTDGEFRKKCEDFIKNKKMRKE